MEAVLWEDVLEAVDRLTEKCAAPAWDIRQTTQDVYTGGELGYYWHPARQQVARYSRGVPGVSDLALSKMALDRAVGAAHVRGTPLGFDEVASGNWVKVAASPTLRRTGQLLNFFPGKYPGGYPNAPSPLAATLSGGLVGAGLGYGAGWLGEKVLPQSWQGNKRLRQTLAFLGALAGASPGAAWSYSALDRDRSLLDGSDLADKPGTTPRLDSEDVSPGYKEAADRLRDVPLGRRYQTAVEGFVKRAFGTFGADYDEPPEPTPLKVDINKMGQTLWEVGADPQTTATTMGALYAAQQLPDDDARPNEVTPHQTGLLGTMMGAAGGGAAGYATGHMAGKALGLLTGMPAGTQNTLKRTGAALGVVNTVVPRLFGAD